MGRFFLASLLVAILVCVGVILVTLAKTKKDEKPNADSGKENKGNTQ